MSELIIPNWHPLFVHFTVALLSAAVLFYLLAYLFTHFKLSSATVTREFEIVGRWCLWLAALITVGTIGAGFYAYYTVLHDAKSHAAMVVHRNWALSTATAIFIVAGWSTWRYLKYKKLTLRFIFALLIAQGLLLITAWHGAELVFRYGVGVMSLPKAQEMKHHHS
ncbi:TPA: DUF2231 domain-containing protein [Legionella pneumophila]